MKLNKQTLFFALLVIAITTVVKLLCAPLLNFSGFTAVIAVALFSGLMIKDPKQAFLFPLLALFISDVLVQVFYKAGWFPFAGFYQGQLINYSLFILLTGLGMLMKNFRTTGMVLSIVLGPVAFFFISNYFVWANQGTTLAYSKDISGLMACYTAGIPFYKNSLVSTIIFLPSFMVLYQWIVSGKTFIKAIFG